MQPSSCTTSTNADAGTTTDITNTNQSMSSCIPEGFPSGNFSSCWGPHIEEGYASLILRLQALGFALWEWHRYIGSVSLTEWAYHSAAQPAQGHWWGPRQWFYLSRSVVHLRSGLVWTLTFLQTIPNTCRMMVEEQRAWAKHHGHRDNNDEGGSGSSSSAL